MFIIQQSMEQGKAMLEHRNREQIYLGAVDLEALIGSDHPARAIWELLESMDFTAYGEQILSREGHPGRAATPPSLLAEI